MTYEDVCVCFSWYGPDKRWLDGALKNARLVPEVYTGARTMLFTDSSVPEESQEVLKRLKEVEVVDCTDMGLEGSARMMWRFCGMDPKVSGRKYMMSRDLDSRVTTRERWCYDDWRANHPGDVLYTMQDSESHPTTPIMGGMFGTRCVWGGMRAKITRWSKMTGNNNFDGLGIDQQFLRVLVWPHVRDMLMTTYAGGRAKGVTKGAVEIPDSVPYVGGPAYEGGKAGGGHLGCPD